MGLAFKGDLDAYFKNFQRKHDMSHMDIQSFFDAIEYLSKKYYKNEEEMSHYDCVNEFLEMCLAYFDELAEE